MTAPTDGRAGEGRGSLPKAYIWDGAISEKARAMCSRHSDQYISDYLGMAIGQVRSIRAALNRHGERGRPRGTPAPGDSGETTRWRDDAIIGSSMLAERINQVFGRRG